MIAQHVNQIFVSDDDLRPANAGEVLERALQDVDDKDFRENPKASLLRVARKMQEEMDADGQTDVMRSMVDTINGTVRIANSVREIQGGGEVQVFHHNNGVNIWVEESPLVLGDWDDPETVGSSSEGSETADTATWSQTEQATDEVGVELWVVGRVVYDHSSDKKLYAMVRKLTYDSLGKLREISAETRVEVDAAESCSQ